MPSISSVLTVVVAVGATLVSSAAVPKATPTPSLATLNNELGMAFLQWLPHDDNAVVAPLAITIGLLTLARAAHAPVGDPTRQLLDLKDAELKAISTAATKLLAQLSASKSGPRVAARLLFSEKLAKDYTTDESSTLSVDFASKETTRALNAWTSNTTDNLMPQLFRDPLSYGETAVLATVGAGRLRLPMANKAERREFSNFVSYSLPGMPVTVDFLSDRTSVRRKRVDAIKSDVVQVPLGEGGDASKSVVDLYLILPVQTDDLQFLNENLTAASLDAALREVAAEKPQTVRLSVPKFRIETDIDFKEALDDFTTDKSADEDEEGKESSSGATPTTRGVSTFAHRVVVETMGAKEEVASTGDDPKEKVSLDRPFVWAVRTPGADGSLVLLGRQLSLVDEKVSAFQFI